MRRELNGGRVGGVCGGLVVLGAMGGENFGSDVRITGITGFWSRRGGLAGRDGSDQLQQREAETSFHPNCPLSILHHLSFPRETILRFCKMDYEDEAVLISSSP